MPDDYLVTAGFKSKKDSSGNPEKHPNPNKTKEEVYPTMANKKQQANPQAVTDPQTGTTTINNNITNYVPATIPFGSENATRTIEHGLNNPDDPDSYIDNRSQEDKENGYINRNDPVDGYNEDTDSAVDEYNDGRRAQIVQWTIVLRRPKWNGEIKNADIKQIYGCTSYFYMCGYI